MSFASSSTTTTIERQSARAAISANKEDRLSVAICLGYGTGTVGVSIMLNAVSTYFPVLMTTVLGQPAEVAGFLMLISKFYDAFMDVIVGALSDRTRSRWGRRRPYLLAGAFVSAAAFLMIFSAPALGDRWLAAYMFAALLLYSSGYAIFTVPYVAMASEMTSDYHQRTRLWSFRTLFVSLGQIFSLAGTAALIKYNGGGSHGYRIMGLVLALIIFTAMISAFFGTAKAQRIERSHGPKISFAAKLRLIGENRYFMWLMGAKLFQFFAFGTTASAVLLFNLNVLQIGYSGQIELALASNITTALVMPLWARITGKIGKKWTYMIAVSIYAAVALSWSFAGSDITQIGLLARGILAGCGSGGLIMLSMAMLSDTMAFDRYHSGMHREGIYSSIVSLLEKVGFAVGAVIISTYLTWAHYIPTKQGLLVAQPASAIHALYMGASIIPALFFFGNLLCIFFYNLDAKTMKAAHEDYEAKNRESGMT